MHTFRVWAPTPRKIELQLDSRLIEMKCGPGGWWAESVEDAGPGTDYGFILDGKGPFPDPRTPWQPHGIHGLSRIVDHSVFRWSDAGWQAPPLASGIIYELHLGTFTTDGTAQSAIEKLDHLLDLGVTHVELMPINEFSGERGWGYDGVDLFAPHHAYGEPDDLKRLVDACHQKGLAVLLDVVYNHLGPTGNYLSQFGPYFTTRYQTPWGEAVNLDGPDSDEVRRFLCDNALMWLRDYHFDGLRLDAVHAVFDQSAVHFLEQLTAEVNALEVALGRHLVLIAESDLNDPRLLWSRERGGYGLDAQWSDDFHHALHAVLTGERDGYYEDFGSLRDLAQAFKQAFVYAGSYSRHRQRRHGRSPIGLSGDRFLGYLQNHDQIGNRACGERSSQLLSTERLKIGAALVLTAPFIPMLFQGEEWGAKTPFLYFTSHDDNKLARAVREGRQKEFSAFGWNPEDIPDPQDKKTLDRSKLDWSEPSKPVHKELFQWHQQLITLRRSRPSLSTGNLQALRLSYDEKEQWFLLQREDIWIACNFSTKHRSIPLSENNRAQVLLSSTNTYEVQASSIVLSPESIIILEWPEESIHESNFPKEST